ETAHDSHPVMPEEPEQDDGGGEVGRHEEGDEVVVVLVDVPPEQLREDDAVAEARDGKELRDALEQAEHDRLRVADGRCGDDHSEAARFGPVWNQAKASAARPTRNEAIPCLT